MTAPRLVRILTPQKTLDALNALRNTLGVEIAEAIARADIDACQIATIDGRDGEDTRLAAEDLVVEWMRYTREGLEDEIERNAGRVVWTGAVV